MFTLQRLSKLDYLLNIDLVSCELEAFGLTETGEAALAGAPDQNRHTLVARQSAKYLEEPEHLLTLHRL